MRISANQPRPASDGTSANARADPRTGGCLRVLADDLSEWVRRAVGDAAAVGSVPSDTPDERLRKSALVLSSVLITFLSFIWVGTYAALGLWRSALIPLAYQVASLVGLAFSLGRSATALYRASQVGMFLVLPFLLQWSLGGFVESGAVALWAFVAPLGALVFYGPRQAIAWFGAFLALVALSAAIDGVLPEPSEDIPSWSSWRFSPEHLRSLDHDVCPPDSFRSLTGPCPSAPGCEQERSETLLLSIFPQAIAERLKLSRKSSRSEARRSLSSSRTSRGSLPPPKDSPRRRSLSS